MSMNAHNPSRRRLLRQIAAGGLGALSWPALQGMAAAAQRQATSASPYRAVVCVFLQGGNDQANTFIPFDDEQYALYSTLRGELALSRANLVDTVLNPAQDLSGLPAGMRLALAPSLAPLMSAWEEGRLALTLNIGPLVKPVTVAQARTAIMGVQDGSVVPPKLFSHIDQQDVWQSYQAEGAVQGWGGRLADAGIALNTGTPALTSINLASSAVFGAGQEATPYMVNPLGPDALLGADPANLGGSAEVTAAFLKLLRSDDASLPAWARLHSAVMRRAIDTNALLRSSLPLADAAVPALIPQDGSDSAHPAAARLAGNPLALQLNQAARLMAIQNSLGIQRQVFFVSLGGFDHHDQLLSRHGPLLAKVADALAQLDADLQTLGLRDQVTVFTASDFGRTVTSNGDGSDHGWGSHHMVMGGAVQGGQVFGQWPDITGFDTGTHNLGQGRLLPTMAVDHLAWALAEWLGVQDSAILQDIAPHRAALGDSYTLGGLLASTATAA
jgi:uncharacterized protein (DUF1501 family)